LSLYNGTAETPIAMIQLDLTRFEGLMTGGSSAWNLSLSSFSLSFVSPLREKEERERSERKIPTPA
jgi:hypothetical protein